MKPQPALQGAACGMVVAELVECVESCGGRRLGAVEKHLEQ